MIITAQAQPQGEVDVAASDLPGNGDESNPYKISNASELQAIEDDLDASYELVSDINASNTARWNNESGFDPIASGSPTEFSGSLDGNNQTITGLTVDRPSEDNIGLFAQSSGTVADISLRDTTLIGGNFVGSLVGFNSNSGTITNVTGTVTVTGSDQVGGVVGSNDGGTIQQTAVSGTVTGLNNIGGVVGTNIAGTVQRVTVSGNIDGSENVGGVVGATTGIVQNTTVSGSVNGSETVGGLAGVIGATSASAVQYVAASSAVTGSSNVSGLVGRNGGTIQNAFTVGSVNGETDTGGVVAFNAGTVENAYVDEQATGQSAGGEGRNIIGLTTAQMQGKAARTNMTALAFGTTWQIQSNDYPALIPPRAQTEFSIKNLSIAGQRAEADILQGTDTNISISVTNTGDITENVTFTVDVGNETGRSILADSVSVQNFFTGTTEQISFNQLNTSTLDARNQPFTVTVSRINDSVVGDLTILEPAEADLTNLSIDRRGVEAEIVEGTDTNVSIEVTNIGEVAGNFTAIAEVGTDNNALTQEITLTVSAGQTDQLIFDELNTSALSASDQSSTITVSTANDSVTGNLSILEPAEADLTNLSIAEQGAEAEIVEDADANVSVDVTNIGEVPDNFTVTAVIDDRTGASVNTATEQQLRVNVSAGGTKRLTFDELNTSTLNAREQSFAITVSTADDSVRGNLTILEPAQAGLADLSIAGQGTESEIVEGTDANVSVEVTNTGEVPDNFTLTASIDNGTGTGVSAGTLTEQELTVDVSAGQTEQLVFDELDVSTLSASNQSFIITISAANESVAGELTILEPAQADLTNLSIAGKGPEAEIVEDTDANVSVTVSNTGDVADNLTAIAEIRTNDSVLTQERNINFSAGETKQIIFDELNISTLNARNQPFTITVSTTNDSVTGNFTISPLLPPPASIIFSDQIVPNGSSLLTVESATFGNESISGEEFVVVVHKTTTAGGIGAKIGESNVLSAGTHTAINVNLTQTVAGNDSVTQLTESQQLIGMLHRADTTDGDEINHGSKITRQGATVTDEAQITIGDRRLVIQPPSQIDRGEPFAVEVLNSSGTTVPEVSMTLDLGPNTNAANRTATTNTSGIAVFEMPTTKTTTTEVITLIASPDGLPAYATGDQLTVTGIRDPGDVQLQSLSIIPKELPRNDSVTVTTELANTNDTDLNQTLILAANETTLDTATVNIPGDTTRTITLTERLTTLGGKNITINGQSAGIVIVTEITPPTPEVGTIRLDETPLPTEANTTADANISVPLSNVGDESEDFTLNLTVTDEDISRTRTIVLNATESRLVTFGDITEQLSAQATPYAVTIEATSTADPSISTSLTTNLSITPAVDDDGSLRITETRAPSRASDGDRFTVSTRVGNFGASVTTDELTFAVDTDRDGEFSDETIQTRQRTLPANSTTSVPFQATATATETGEEQQNLSVRLTTSSDTVTRNLSVVSTEFTTAVSTGDPHIVSFDGVAYDFQAAGEFTLAREPTQNGSLVVQARQEPLADSESITRNTAVATVLDNNTVIIDATDSIPLQINGSEIAVNRSETITVGNGTITRTQDGNTLTVTYPGADNEISIDDERLAVDLYNNRVDIELSLDPDRDRPVEGVFGPADGNATNDIGLPNGTALAQPPRAEQLYGVFRKSWRVNNSTTLFGYENNNGPETYYDPTIPAGSISLADLDQTERQEAEQRALDAGLKPGTVAFRNAVLDFTLTGDGSYLTSAQQQNTSAETTTVVGAPTESVVRVGSASLGPGGTADINISLERAPEGLAGYNLTASVSVAETSGVRVVDADAPGVFNNSVTETTVGQANQTAEIRATDIRTVVESNATDISLGEITIAANETTDVSEVPVTVTVSRIDDDTGSPIDIETRNGTMSVTEQPPLAEGLNPPTDPDNDGVLEDVNGNGRVDFNDVVILFENLPDAEAPLQDVNNNGRIDFDDIVELFKEI